MSMDISQRVQEGLQHHQAGRFGEADAIYRSILSETPDHPEILYLMSVLSLQVGNFQNAANFIAQAINFKADEPNYHNIAGEAHLALGDVDSAIAAYKQAIALDPGFAGAHINLGNACKQLGQLEDAVSHYRRAAALDPDMAVAHNNLGIALKELGQPQDALQHLGKAVSIAPNYAEAHSNLGNLLQALGRPEEAIAHHEQALALMPGYAMAHSNLGVVLRALGRLEEAITQFGHAIAIDPNFAMAHYNLGIAVDDSGRPDAAAEHYGRALSIDPDYAEAHHNLGNVLDQLGQRTDAVAHYEQAIRINPRYAEAHRNLARMNPAKADPLPIEQLLASPSLAEEDAIHCHFALGSIYDRAGEFDRAFENYSKGNILGRKAVSYDGSKWTRYIDGLIDAYSTEFFSEMLPADSDSEVPVFIIGMPRSGTTLMEQIVASHNEVYGAGELPSFGRFEEELANRLGGWGSFAKGLRQIDPGTILEFSQRYLDELRDLAPEASRVTDKMPGNFVQLGLIKLLFPNCRIIHCRRNAMDTCLSNYFNYFAAGNQYSFDLEELGRHYLDYKKIMAHWDAIFGPEILEVHYEELVADQETVTRRVIDYLGLDWDDSCLKHYENRRAVHNLSSRQVRRPVYASSVGRWKNYEKHLQPLTNVLAKLNGESP
jgi:tetratricopeptide (TPR) repeat protein